MKKIALLFIIALLSNYITAQTRQPVVVTNWGDLYSSSELSATDKDEIIAQSSAAELEKVLKAYRDTQWPSGINDLDERLNNRAELARYTVYKVATLSSGSVIIVAPAAENKHMSVDMQSDRDIYFVLAASAFTSEPYISEDTPLYDESEYDYTYTDYSGLTTFNEQLSAILTEAGGDFINIWGDDLYNNPEAMEQYESLVVPDGANFADVIADYSYIYTFWAGYGEFDNQQDARRAYESLVSKVNTAHPECCTLENQGQTVNDTLTFTSWLVASPPVYVEVQVGKIVDPADNKTYYPLFLAVTRSE
ncbi:MAG: hypothetical protein AB7G44_11020 [Bacteroidia bacterium]